MYIIKLDSSGNLKKTLTIGGTADEAGSSIIQSKDGGYAVTGYSSSFGAGGEDVYVIKLDSGLNLKWSRTIGTPHDAYWKFYSSNNRWWLCCWWNL